MPLPTGSDDVAQEAQESFEDVGNDLAGRLRTLCHDSMPFGTARQLLEYDRPGPTAPVGLDCGGRSAAIYHEVDRYAIAVPGRSDGLADG